MSHENARRAPLISQLLLLLMVAMLLYLIASFAQQVTVSREQQKKLERLDQQVAAETENQERLESALAHAYSANAVEEWAHKNGWGTEHEHTVATFSGSEMPSTDNQTAPEDAVSEDSPRDAWWSLFFGTQQ